MAKNKKLKLAIAAAVLSIGGAGSVITTNAAPKPVNANPGFGNPGNLTKGLISFGNGIKNMGKGIGNGILRLGGKSFSTLGGSSTSPKTKANGPRVTPTSSKINTTETPPTTPPPIPPKSTKQKVSQTNSSNSGGSGEIVYAQLDFPAGSSNKPFKPKDSSGNTIYAEIHHGGGSPTSNKLSKKPPLPPKPGNKVKSNKLDEKPPVPPKPKERPGLKFVGHVPGANGSVYVGANGIDYFIPDGQ